MRVISDGTNLSSRGFCRIISVILIICMYVVLLKRPRADDAVIIREGAFGFFSHGSAVNAFPIFPPSARVPRDLEGRNEF